MGEGMKTFPLKEEQKFEKSKRRFVAICTTVIKAKFQVFIFKNVRGNSLSLGTSLLGFPIKFYVFLMHAKISRTTFFPLSVLLLFAKFEKDLLNNEL